MHKLLKKISTLRLTRREFLSYLGALLLGFVGFEAMIKTLDQGSSARKKNLKKVLAKPSVRQYGSGAYGI